MNISTIAFDPPGSHTYHRLNGDTLAIHRGFNVPYSGMHKPLYHKLYDTFPHILEDRLAFRVNHNLWTLVRR